MKKQFLEQKPANRIIMTAVWFAILTGLGEFAILLASQFILHRYIYYMGAYLLWMTPLADLIVFSIPAILLLLINWRWSKLISLPLTAGIFAFLSFLSLLLLYSRLQRLAAVILAAGLAVQTARIIGHHPRLYYELLQRSMGWAGFFSRRGKDAQSQNLPVSTAKPLELSRREFLVSAGATVAGLALGVTGWDVVAQKLALANLPIAKTKFPNVLMIVLDTVRASHLSLYGYHRPTSPELERLAKSGVVFDRAVATASWTLPSHASMFTGRYPHELSVNWDHGLDRTYPTLAEILKVNGYETAGFVSNIWYCSRESGLNRGFTQYEDFSFSLGQVLNSSSLIRNTASNDDFRRVLEWYNELGRKPAPVMNSDFISWLSHRDQRQPFFAFINYFDAHGPYLPPPPYDTIFGARKYRENPRHVVGWKWSSEQIQLEMNAYDGSIAYLDRHLGSLFDTLEKNGILENTLVVIASDHGEEFLEHGVVDHGYSLYWPSLHTLLMISFPPRVPSGWNVSASVTLRDLPETILDLVGLSNQTTFPGRSLTRFWEDGSVSAHPPSEFILSEVGFTPGYPRWYPITRGDMRSLVVDRFHYIKNGDGSEELYDFNSDPLEKQNVVDLKENRKVAQQLRDYLQGS